MGFLLLYTANSITWNFSSLCSPVVFLPIREQTLPLIMHKPDNNHRHHHPVSEKPTGIE